MKESTSSGKLKQSDLRIGELVILNSIYNDKHGSSLPFYGIVTDKDLSNYGWIKVFWFLRNKETPVRIDTISKL